MTEVGESLTPQEEQIMWHLAAGEEPEEIGALLGYDVSNVNRAIRTIVKKLGVRNRLSAMHAWTMLQPRYIVKLRRIRGANVPVYGPKKDGCDE